MQIPVNTWIPSIFVHWNQWQLFTTLRNIIHKESHFTFHVYLTAYRAMNSKPPGLEHCSVRCHKEAVFRMHYSDGYTFPNKGKTHFPLNSSLSAGDQKYAAKTKPKYIDSSSHIGKGCSTQCTMHMPMQHSCCTMTTTQTHTHSAPTWDNNVLKYKEWHWAEQQPSCSNP